MSVEDKIDAMLTLKSGGRLLIGRDRVAILEAIAKHGSITNAAKEIGVSYKGAWDAVSAVNNLLPRPAVILRSGGRQGGGAVVTDEGRRLIFAFRRLEEKLARVSALIAEEGLNGHPDLLFWSVAMKTSARNIFHCIVTDVHPASVNVGIVFKISDDHSFIATVTNASMRELDLTIGRHAVALVKSSAVMLAPAEDHPRISTPNRILGTVLDRTDDGVSSEIRLDLGAGKTLVSVITKGSADDLQIAIGDRLCAFFNPSQVILAVD